jgi:hypothetical protein
MDLSDCELSSEERNKSSRKRSKISKFFDSLRLPLNGNTDKEVNHKVSKEETQTDPQLTTRDHQDRTSNETLRSSSISKKHIHRPKDIPIVQETENLQ